MQISRTEQLWIIKTSTAKSSHILEFRLEKWDGFSTVSDDDDKRQKWKWILNFSSLSFALKDFHIWASLFPNMQRIDHVYFCQDEATSSM